MALHKTQRRANKRKTSGFSLIEVLVALILVGILGVVAGGFLLPMRMMGNSNSESKALAYGRSAFEIVKNRWLDRNNFESIAYPKLTGALADIKLDTGWTLTFTCQDAVAVTATPCVASDLLRRVTVTVTPPNRPALTLSTQIARPSYE